MHFIVSVAVHSMSPPEVCDEKKKTTFFLLLFFNVSSFLIHCCNWYQGELSVILSKATGIQTLSQVSVLGVPHGFPWVSAGTGAHENNLFAVF